MKALLTLLLFSLGATAGAAMRLDDQQEAASACAAAAPASVLAFCMGAAFVLSAGLLGWLWAKYDLRVGRPSL